MAVSRERLADLLVDPREDLDCEIKNWLDLQSSNDDKATFSKAVLALANHGGGFIILGLAETDAGTVEAEGRPVALDGYSQDLINGIVQNYCDPPFHCAVHIVSNPVSVVFPIAVVPGGHRVPIRARRAGPNGNTVQNNAIYIRKPGPRSETPQSAQDWDHLLARCLRNRRDEMFDQIRDLIKIQDAYPFGAPTEVATKVSPPPMPRSAGPLLSQARSVLSVMCSISVMARSPQRFTKKLWGKNSGRSPQIAGHKISPTIYPTESVRYAETACYVITPKTTLIN